MDRREFGKAILGAAVTVAVPASVFIDESQAGTVDVIADHYLSFELRESQEPPLKLGDHWRDVYSGKTYIAVKYDKRYIIERNVIEHAYLLAEAP